MTLPDRFFGIVRKVQKLRRLAADRQSPAEAALAAARARALCERHQLPPPESPLFQLMALAADTSARQGELIALARQATRRPRKRTGGD